MCLTGPKDSLDATVHAQPALLVAGYVSMRAFSLSQLMTHFRLAAVEQLKTDDPASVQRCDQTLVLTDG